jgi:EmrB/QacA subfamily drug resistance transporter
MQRASKWLVFVLVAIAQFMVVLDSAITNVALPTIKSQLGFSNDSLQWVVTAYALTFGGFLLLGGRAADLFGRRRVLLAGMTGFTVFSFLIGISHTSFELIALRALQGSAAALMSPAALSIVLTTFRDGPNRNKALAYWTLVATAGAALGLLLGGVLTQYVGWRWNFFINVPVGIVMLGLIRLLVPKHEGATESRSLDLPGAILATGGLMTIVLGVSQAPVWGWTSGSTLATFGLGLALIVGFVLNERRAAHPLVPLGIFKTRNVTGANLMMAPMYATMLGLFYIVTLYFQTILNYSPVEAGLAFLPMPIILGVMSTRISGLVNRYGFKRFLVAGPIIVGLGLLWLSKLPVGGHYLSNVLPGLILIPIGIGLTFMPIISAATSGVPGEQAGLASGLISTSQQMGGAVGLAVLSGVAASTTAGSLYLGKVGALVHGFDQGIVAGIGFVGFAILLGAFVITQPKRETPKPNEQEARVAPRRQPKIQLG